MRIPNWFKGVQRENESCLFLEEKGIRLLEITNTKWNVWGYNA